MNHPLRIIYIKPSDSSFILIDQRILEEKYDVKPILLHQMTGRIVYGIRLFGLVIKLLSSFSHPNVIFVAWFADYHSALMVFLAKLLRKKSVVFIGGQEAIYYPELKKGVYRKKIRGWCVKYALRNTSLIIANHQSLVYHENTYYNQEQPHIDGIKHYVRGLNTKIEIIHNGINFERFQRDKSVSKIDNLVLTVGTMMHMGDFNNKGFDLFIEVARRNPLLNFVLIGLNTSYLDVVELNYHVSEILNLEIIPFSSQALLNEKYNQAKVFVQASITEGMPNTLSEAMLLECVPVGSNVNGIPDAIGDTGVIIKHRDVEELEKGILKALEMNSGAAASSRVLSLFNIPTRGAKIRKLMEGLV